MRLFPMLVAATVIATLAGFFDLSMHSNADAASVTTQQDDSDAPRPHAFKPDGSPAAQ